jgi:signal transduction histidine kinase
MDSADKINILVVDDLPEKILVYRSILEELGQNLITVNSGAEALKQVLLHNFAVILLDVHMPGMDGFETAALIRKRKKSAYTPIIFITAFADEVQAAQGYAQGAVDYILAPVVPEVLRAKVKVFVDLFRMQQQMERQAEERVILAEERAKRAAAEDANRRSAFLAEASRILANSLDFEATLRGLAGLAVPFLADLSVVCLADEHGQPGRTEWAWTTPGAVGPACRAGPDVRSGSASQTYGTSPCLADAVRRVLATGQPELWPQIHPPAPVGRISTPSGGQDGVEISSTGEQAGDEASRVAADFLLRSAAILPLAARGKTLGALALALGPSGRHYDPGDLALAEDLACRAAIAIDNALLVRNIQEADHRKDEFLAMLAHELRNPLAPIRNAVYVMRLLGSDRPEVERARDVIDRQLQHLARLVDDLLDVSRITRGKIQLQLESIDVAVAVANAVETTRPLIEARKHELILSLPQEPVRVRADLARLAQILANLLNNAAKYTEEGGRIWLTVEQEGSEVVFRVRDTGAGISPEMLSRVFDLFTQADQSLDRSQGGLGIGLTLVHRLVELHHGSVEGFSQGPGQGSEFIVRLPALGGELSQEMAGNGGATAPGTGTRCRVLVVEDNIDAAECLALVVRLDGHEVRTVYDGLAALQVAEAFRPEIILLDLGLPKMDGYEVARRLRDQPGGNGLLLVAVTGHGQEEDRLRACQAGFDYHLIKPVDPEMLRRVIASRTGREVEQRVVIS